MVLLLGAEAAKLEQEAVVVVADLEVVAHKVVVPLVQMVEVVRVPAITDQVVVVALQVMPV